MTASAISQAIRKLENYYGVKLLNRTTRSLTLTASRAHWHNGKP
ncbi:MAG: LysR family transcriptional regulator [Haemophilus parainfluenzae]|nr:LysR family transcriptional regulator [Haemophilus parainfluenzae]MDU6259056.1 LysR family transcriptional regulator [Haemophilus parainfluenzae]